MLPWATMVKQRKVRELKCMHIPSDRQMGMCAHRAHNEGAELQLSTKSQVEGELQLPEEESCSQHGHSVRQGY